jgi:hypothetical protein
MQAAAPASPAPAAPDLHSMLQIARESLAVAAASGDTHDLMMTMFSK